MSTATSPSLLDFSNALAEAAAKAGNSTVLVNARRRLPASGIAIAPDLVLTADHALEREEDIRVRLASDVELPAQIAGRDPGSDLAVLRLARPEALAAEPAPQPARIGQIVLALGRPGGLQASLGVISAIGGPARTARGGLLERYLRTDTTSFPGFSGGPLVDAAGRVLGMNTSGFGWDAAVTIPADLAWQTAQTLAQHGHIRRGYLGIRSQPVELPETAQQALGRRQEAGLLLVGVEAGAPAAHGGLMVGDILVGVNGHPLTDPDELLARLSGEVVGQSIPLELLRGGQPLILNVTVQARV